MRDSVVFVAARRTPFGKFGGSFASLSATELGARIGRDTLSSASIAPEQIDQVVFGNVIQSSKDAAYLARHIGLRCEVPEQSPAVTVNRLCGSGFEAIHTAVRLIQLGEAKTCLAGGTENMSQAPYVLRRARFGYRLGNAELEDSLMTGLTDQLIKLPMAETAENLAKKYSISREQSDAYSALSHQRAHQAWENGLFSEEVAPVTLASKKGDTIVNRDEHIRADSTAESLAKLKPSFRADGTITAGNASGICDGAACVVVSSKSHAQSQGWEILGEWIDGCAVGVDPKIMGIGPVAAIKKVLQSSSHRLDQMDRIEVNEAFAPQYLAVEKELGLDREKTNTEGGAIAIGHPLAASGARLTLHLLHSLRKKGGGMGLASACIGGGQGSAVIVKV